MITYLIGLMTRSTAVGPLTGANRQLTGSLEGWDESESWEQ